MEHITLNFVLEFARDLQKLLETLEKEFGQNLVRGNAYQRKKIEKRASELTENLYEQFHKLINLKLEKNEIGFNDIVIVNIDTEKVYILQEYINSKLFFDLKKD